MDFKSYANQKQNQQEKMQDNSHHNPRQDYKNMSDSQLRNEVIKEAMKARQAGKLNNEMLLELKKKIAPMLSKEQLEKLDEVLKMIMT